jgi:hypothetical protein
MNFEDLSPITRPVPYHLSRMKFEDLSPITRPWQVAPVGEPAGRAVVNHAEFGDETVP